MKKFVEKYMYTIRQLLITFSILKINHVFDRCLKPFLYLSKNNFSVFEADSKKIKLYAFIPSISYA